MSNKEQNNLLYAVYILLNQNKFGTGIFFEWEKINKNRLKCRCDHKYIDNNSIDFETVIKYREKCLENNCIFKDENLLGIYSGDKIDMFWNDFYAFTNHIIDQKIKNKTSILDIMKNRLEKRKNKKININTYWPQLDNVIGTC